MPITLEQIKELRRLTGAGVTVVKEALDHSNGDIDKSINYLREKGMLKAAKRSGKSADNGYIAYYIHGEGTIGVLVELNSETDFTARNEKFRKLANDLAIHIAATNPRYISKDNIPVDELNKEKALAGMNIDEKKPVEIREKIVEGKLVKYYEEVVLLEQRYVRDESKKIQDLINETISAIGEKIEIGRFCRFQIAEPASCGL
ncbi:MAG: translation elongation factor Ts [bacterium]